MFKFFKRKKVGLEKKPDTIAINPTPPQITVNPTDDDRETRNKNRISHIQNTLEGMSDDDPRRRGFELELKRRYAEQAVFDCKREEVVNGGN